MGYKYFLLCLLLSLTKISVASQSSNSDVLSRLDKLIENKYIYKVEKNKYIDAAKFSLENSTNLEAKIALSQKIFEEYKSYRYDSAYVYALDTYRYAKESRNINLIAQAQCNLLFCYSTVGFFKEASDIIDEFERDILSEKSTTETTSDSDALNDEVLAQYYAGVAHYYRNLMLYVGNSVYLSENYRKKAIEYTNLALAIYEPSSIDYRLLEAENRLFMREDIDKSIDEIQQLIENSNLTLHKKAITYSWLATAYEEKKETQKAINCVALSAIYDIESSTYETTAAKVLARYMFESGDISRANKYIKLALDDAQTYNSPFRMLEIQTLMPTIEELRYSNIEKDRRFLTIVSAIFILFIFVIVFMFVKLKKSNKNLSKARREIEDRAEELAQFNSQLSLVNDQLAETNKIKDLYIIKSLFGDSAFVDKVEKMCKALSRKIKAKQFSELDPLIGGLGIKRERERMSSSFDSAFLKLFPNFIEEYNKLFPAEYATTLGEDGALSPEVRIFALIRLGIEDINQIASYLNLSPNTIYVYKAKVKARTIVDKSQFESYIKKIG
ncbi:MAG: DUF6377 domain-containing protein [Rikenellaceae bacterium]